MQLTTFRKLQKYEHFLYTAEYSNYIRTLTTKQVDDMIKIAAEIDIIYSHNHCPLCLLKFVQRVAKPYFEFKQKMEDNAGKKKKVKKD